MSNDFQGLASAAYNLKIWYQGPLVDQINEDVPIYRGAAKSSFKYEGSQVNRPLRTVRNPGIGATSDGGTLPKIGRQSGQQAVIQAKYNYLRFGITGPMLKAAMTGGKGAFVAQAAHELKMGYEDLKNDENRQCSWDGTGDLALLNAAVVASNSMVVKGRESGEEALKFLDVGMVVDIYNGTTQVASGIEITAISSGNASSSTATLTLDQNITVSEDDIVVRSGSYGYEVQGLLTQLDGATSTVFSLDRTTPSLQGNVVDLSAGQLTIDSLEQLWNQCQRRGGGKLSAIFSDYASLRMYKKLLTPDKRYVNTVKGDGGFARKDENYAEYNGIPFVPDKDCPQRIFMLPQEYIEKMILCEMEFADESGSMYIPQTSADSFEVRVRHFFNLFNAKASASGVLTNYVSP